MPRRQRLDAELVRRGLARSRAHAGELIDQRRVLVDGLAAMKAATAIGTDAALVVTQHSDEPDFVSRGAHKLAGAFTAFEPLGLVVEGRHVLDAGASTGGFTDVVLRRGAAHVIAVDVGYGQLAWRLRNDPRVRVVERTNVRDLVRGQFSPPPDLVVADLSFISLTVVLPALVAVAGDDADFVVMVKPQFEVGREGLGKGGVVRDPDLRAEAVIAVARAATERGLGLRAAAPSPLPGPAGNLEYFLWLRRHAPPPDDERIRAIVAPDLTSSAAGDRRPAIQTSGSDESTDADGEERP